MLAKRLAIWGIVTFVLALSAGRSADAADYASIVIEADSGRVLFAVNENDPNYPASLTKMMTLYLVFDALESGKLELDQRLPVSRHAASRPPSRLGLKPGQSIRVRDAILALTTKSANDVAAVLAEALGGTEAGFARRMTAKARELGMTRTVFRNASGLPDPEQVSTARDLARLSQALIFDHPEYYHYFSAERFSYRGRTYRTHNHLVGDYPGADGIKTGYIRASGFNVATSAVRSDRRLIAVVMGGETARGRDDHMAALLDTAFGRLATADGTTIWPDRPPVVAAATSTGRTGRRVAAAEIAGRGAAAVPSSTPGIRAASIGSATGRERVRLIGDRSWAIQVGVFSNAASAESIARKAALLLPDLPQDVTVGVTTKRSPSDRTLYRARLIGVSREVAHQACERLTRREMECWAVAAEEPSA